MVTVQFKTTTTTTAKLNQPCVLQKFTPFNTLLNQAFSSDIFALATPRASAKCGNRLDLEKIFEFNTNRFALGRPF